MSINACTINAHTINALRCRRPQLIAPVVTPVVGTNNSSLRADFARRYPQFTRHAEVDDQPIFNFEQPFVTVTATLLGATGTQQLEMTAQADFVVVTNLKVDAQGTAETVVNITNFRID